MEIHDPELVKTSPWRSDKASTQKNFQPANIEPEEKLPPKPNRKNLFPLATEPDDPTLQAEAD